jgi:hypothetical protein
MYEKTNLKKNVFWCPPPNYFGLRNLLCTFLFIKTREKNQKHVRFFYFLDIIAITICPVNLCTSFDEMVHISEKMGEVIFYDFFFWKKKDFLNCFIVFLKCTINTKFEKNMFWIPPNYFGLANLFCTFY